MKAFFILGCLVAVARAGLLPGYNYGPGVTPGSELITSSGVGTIGGLSHIGGGVIGSGGSVISAGGGGLIAPSIGGLSNIGSSVITTGGSVITPGSSGLIVPSVGVSSIGGGITTVGAGLSRGTTVLGIDAVDSVPQQVEVSKQFFHFTAPDEIVDQGQTTQQLSNVLKKNLQVVFIKAPENNAATNAALQIAKQAIEQKTSIYVLSKENDAAQVVGQLQQIQENVPTTPEVRIIKYRTPEDIAHAKHTIQSQYESIGGLTQNIDGGVAPVLNYASNVHAGHVLGGSTIGYGTHNIIGGGNLVSSVGPNYLPATPLKK